MAQLIIKVAQPHDRLVVVGGSPEQAAALAQEFGFTDLPHVNSSMGFIQDPYAVTSVLEFVE